MNGVMVYFNFDSSLIVPKLSLSVSVCCYLFLFLLLLNNLKVGCRYDSVFLNFSVGKHTFYRNLIVEGVLFHEGSQGLFHIEFTWMCCLWHYLVIFWTINWQIMHLLVFFIFPERRTGEFLYVRIWGEFFLFWNRHTF